MLDVSVRAGIMNLMLSLSGELGLASLYITHDLAVARAMSTRIAVMYLGAVVEEGPTETLVSGAAHPYTRLLVGAVPEHRAGSRRARLGRGLRRYPAGVRRGRRARLEDPEGARARGR